MAMASVSAGRKLNDQSVVFGEVGRGGEVRSAMHSERRLDEAKKLGFKVAITPRLKTKSALARPVSDLRTALIDYLQK